MASSSAFPRSFQGRLPKHDPSGHDHCAARASGTLLLLLAGLALVAGCASPAKGGGPPQYPPPDVTTAVVEQRDMPLFGEWVANLDGYTNAQIEPQVAGYVIRQDYKEGSLVHKGQVLYEIDPRPFIAALDQAKAQLAQSQAQLGLTEINVKRDKPLAEARAIARSQLDNDLQSQSANQAGVKAAEANVAVAQLNVGFTKVRSLLDGIAGIATVQTGGYVKADTVMTTVSQVQPIKVYFAISEQEYLALTKKAREGGAADLLHSSNRVPVELTLSNGSVYPGKGSIVFVDRAVNPATGTIRVAAAFPNPQNLLRPGQFGKVRAQTEVQKGVLLVPQRAVTELQGTYQVAVVDDANKVHMHTVHVGAQVGKDWLVTSGLSAGDHVVIEGNGKLADGIPVHPHPAAATGAPEGQQADSAGPADKSSPVRTGADKTRADKTTGSR